MRINGHRWARSFEDEQPEAEPGAVEAEPAPGDEPDYNFEGFSVEFLAKVQMLPVSDAPAKGPR
jgi:hypothetical protein